MLFQRLVTEEYSCAIMWDLLGDCHSLSLLHHNSTRWCTIPSLTKYQAFLNANHFCSFLLCRYCKSNNPQFFWDIYLSPRSESVSKQLQHLYHWIAACFCKWKPFSVIQCPVIIVSLSIIIMDGWLSSWKQQQIYLFFLKVEVTPNID